MQTAFNADLKPLKDEFDAKVAPLQAEFKAKVNALGAEALDTLAKAADGIGLKYAVVRGTTPSWNDGDVCTHSSSAYVWDKWGDANEYISDAFDLDAVGEGEHYNSVTEENARSVTNFLEQYDEYILQPTYGTNYQAKLLFENGGVIIVVDEDVDPDY